MTRSMPSSRAASNKAASSSSVVPDEVGVGGGRRQRRRAKRVAEPGEGREIVGLDLVESEVGDAGERAVEVLLHGLAHGVELHRQLGVIHDSP